MMARDHGSARVKSGPGAAIVGCRGDTAGGRRLLFDRAGVRDPGEWRGCAGRVAIVTGGTKGIGRAIAERPGPRRGPCHRRLTTPARRPLQHLPVTRISPFQGADVSIASQFQNVVDTTVSHYGGLDILVNSAGVMLTKPIKDTSEEEFARVMDTNVKGVFLSCKAALGPMSRAHSGSIVNLGSVDGIMANPDHSAYACSKSAVHGLTKAIAVEMGPANVRCNAICPGWIQTALNEAYFSGLKRPEAAEEALRALHPLRRLGSPRGRGEPGGLAGLRRRTVRDWAALRCRRWTQRPASSGRLLRVRLDHMWANASSTTTNSGDSGL